MPGPWHISLINLALAVSLSAETWETFQQVGQRAVWWIQFLIYTFEHLTSLLPQGELSTRAYGTAVAVSLPSSLPYNVLSSCSWVSTSIPTWPLSQGKSECPGPVIGESTARPGRFTEAFSDLEPPPRSLAWDLYRLHRPFSYFI